MFRTSKLLLPLFSSIIFTGCIPENKSKDVAVVKPEKIQVQGDLSEYLQVVDNDYEITENFGGDLSIRIKAIKALPKSELAGKRASLTASLIAENGAPVSGSGIFFSEGNDKLITLLRNGSGEEIINMKALLGQYNAKDHAAKAKKFIVSSELQKNENEVEQSSKSSENSSTANDYSSNSGSENWEKLLNDYEEYVDEYIKASKKAMEGDQTALTEYMDLVKKSTDLQVTIQKAQADNKLSPEQISKLHKLIMKFGSSIKN